MRPVLFQSAILKAKLKSLVGSELTYHRNYLKTKLFNFSKSGKEINEFSKFLFGSEACYDKALKQTAASLRFFRDEHYQDWKRLIESDKRGFNNSLRSFYEDYGRFVAQKLEEERMTMEDYLDAVLKSDEDDIKEV